MKLCEQMVHARGVLTELAGSDVSHQNRVGEKEEPFGSCITGVRAPFAPESSVTRKSNWREIHVTPPANHESLNLGLQLHRASSRQFRMKKREVSMSRELICYQ